MERQECRVCGKFLPLSDFSYRKERQKHRTHCKRCRSTEEAAKRYNATVGEIQKLVDKQNNSCAICGISAEDIPHKSFEYNPLVIDHDHTTGKIRGLLCPYCNTMLGMAKDSVDTLRKAINYLLADG
jgi:hypothetical protein